MRAVLIRVVAAAAILFAAAALSPHPFQIAVAGFDTGCGYPIAAIRYYAEWVGGTLPGSQGGVTRIAAAPRGRIYGIAGSNILRLQPGSSAVTIATLPALHTGLGMTIDARGRMYVLVEAGRGNAAIDVFARSCPTSPWAPAATCVCCRTVVSSRPAERSSSGRTARAW